jgi:hypothetical protein
MIYAPDLRPRTATRFGGPIVDHTHAAFGHPVIGQPHQLVVKQRVIAEIIHPEHITSGSGNSAYDARSAGL